MPPWVALNKRELMDADGYPEDDELETIEKWPWDHPLGWRGLFDYVKERWYMADWGWSEVPGTDIIDGPVTKFNVSTAGWSGNESIVGSMQRNWMFWSSCWEQSRRGGHFIFELKPSDESPKEHSD